MLLRSHSVISSTAKKLRQLKFLITVVAVLPSGVFAQSPGLSDEISKLKNRVAFLESLIRLFNKNIIGYGLIDQDTNLFRGILSGPDEVGLDPITRKIRYDNAIPGHFRFTFGRKVGVAPIVIVTPGESWNEIPVAKATARISSISEDGFTIITESDGRPVNCSFSFLVLSGEKEQQKAIEKAP
jgi:hypothetical protein